jgi:hypothetical protein
MSEWETEGQGGATEGVDDDELGGGSDAGEMGGGSEDGAPDEPGGMDDEESGGPI